MGSTLTNTQPKDTYKSLLKTSDSTELSATAKYVSDGNGNDSPLALSTSSVGIGTASPAYPLSFGKSVYGGVTSVDFYRITLQDNGGISNDVGIGQPQSGSIGINCEGGGYISFYNGTNGIKARIDNDGLKFGSDTAAANALDDYEEGTWTMGITFGGGSTGVVYGTNTGAYTKIGRKVTVTGYLSLNNKGTSTGDVAVTGLPFPIGTGGQFSSSVSVFLNSVSYTGTAQLIGLSGAAVIQCYQISEAGSLSTLTNSNFGNLSEVYLSFTYFV